MERTDDYRLSHAQRGGSYDSLLANSPFDAYMTSWETWYLRDIVPALFPGGVPRYLDFACGTGRVTAVVAPFGRESVGVDVSPTMLDAARKKLPEATFHLCDLTRETMELGLFNLVTSFRFFGNAQNDLREAALAAIVRRMAPGGYLVINSHRNPRALYALLDRLTGGDSGSMDLHFGKLRRLLKRHGLEVRRVQPIGAWMYRARLLNAFAPDDPVAAVNERRFSHSVLASVSPDVVVVAQRV